MYPEMLFFGAVKQPGHFLWRPSGCRAGHAFENALPFSYGILDAGLIPKRAEQTEGHAGRSAVNGWTIVSFWDRSVDGRGMSNSAFVYPAEMSFDEMVRLSRIQIPWFWERVKFEVVLRYK